VLGFKIIKESEYLDSLDSKYAEGKRDGHEVGLKDGYKLGIGDRQKALIKGREIERLSILRYTKSCLSGPKWQEFNDYYKGEELEAKYGPELDKVKAMEK